MSRPRKLQETDTPTKAQKEILRDYFGIQRATNDRYRVLRFLYNSRIQQIRQEYDDRQVIANLTQGILRNVVEESRQEARARQVLRRGLRRRALTSGSIIINPQTTNIHEVYKQPLKQFKGKQVKVITFVDGRVLFSVVLDIPAERFNNWWSDNFFTFMEDSKTSKIDRYDPNQLKIVFTPNVELNENRAFQYFAEGVSNCMLKPIKEWAEELKNGAKSKQTKSRYNIILKDIIEFEKKYPNGIPENGIQEIADKLQVDISVEQPISRNQFIVCKAQKKALRTFTFVNTRLNHLELNNVVNNDFQQIDSESLQSLGEDLERSDTFFDYKKDRNGRYTKIRTLEGKYQATSDYNEVVNSFEYETGLSLCKIDMLNDPVSHIIREGVHYNGTIDFKDSDGFELNHIDMEKAYANFKTCIQYEGFVGKITDYRKTDKIQAIGYYRAYDFDFSKVEASKLYFLKRMNCYLDHNVYPSVELKWLRSIGVDFKIEEGCWGTKINFEFTKAMIEGKDYIDLTNEKKVRYYCKWSGSQTSYSSYQSFCMKGTKEFFENMKSVESETDCVVKCFQDGEGVIEYPRKHDFCLAHITGFITMYQRLSVFNQLFNMKPSNIVRVCVDGIYFEPHNFVMIDPFRTKEDINLNNLPGLGYCSNVLRYGKYLDEMDNELECIYFCSENEPRKHYKRELFKGAGGNGKTHFNLTDKGLVRLCYIAPSYKLARTKEKEYDIRTNVLARALHEEYHKDILKYYNVLVFDEVSQYSELDKQKIFSIYGNCKLIFCGDIGYQLPCIEGIPMNETSFDNVKELKHNYRFTCEKQRQICLKVREMIDDDCEDTEINEFIKNSYTNVREIDYKPTDMILCSRTNCGVKGHSNCNCNGKNYSKEWNDKYEDNKWKCVSSTRQYSKGEIVIGEKPQDGGWEKRHGYTIHSVQGETYDENIFIDARNLFDRTMGYTAISRARSWDQVKIVV